MVKKKFGKDEPTFSEKVLYLALRIPKGRVTTYGALARAAGGGLMASQSITSILGKAWERGEKTIPFHRIVYADGKVWMSDEYREKRMKQYKAEKIHINDRDRITNFHDIALDVDELRELT